jgi:hypothetical protein
VADRVVATPLERGPAGGRRRRNGPGRRSRTCWSRARWRRCEPDWPASRTGPEEWREATFLTQAISWLTAAELADIQSDIHALLFRYADRAVDPEARPPDSRMIRFAAWGVPAVPAEFRDEKGTQP